VFRSVTISAAAILCTAALGGCNSAWENDPGASVSDPSLAAPSDAQIETGNYEGAPSDAEPIDINGDGQYGYGDNVDSEDAGIDDDYDGQTDEYGESCPDGCAP
jgi:hypothetical protein